MKLKYFLITGILVFISVIYCNGQAINKIFDSYEEMRNSVVKNFQEGKFEEAANTLKDHLEIFPEKLMANTYNLSLCYGSLKEYNKGVDILMKGIENNVWYNKWAFEGEFWENYKTIDAFREFLKINNSKRLEAQKYSKPDILVLKPENFDKNKKYPLFIALHGGGGTIKVFKELWKSDIMNKEYIVAYLQSSQLAGMDSYTWDNMELANTEISNAFNKITNEYLVDSSNIVIGGFSAGGRASIYVASKSEIPIAGFVVLSPPVPDGFSQDDVLNIKKKNVRGTIISNSKDPRYADQRLMSGLFKENGVQYQFIETPAIGHWFPENLYELIDQSILFIRNK